VVTAAYVVNFVWRRGDPTTVGSGMIALSAASLAALAVSGTLGGKLAFRYGVRVADESMQADGYVTRQRSAAHGSEGGVS
jgi:uncharacterized membrane protein